MSFLLYLDENVDVALAQALRQQGYDVVSAREVENLGLSDEAQLAYAISTERAILTHNISDFVRLHQKYLAEGKAHFGIIGSDLIELKQLIQRSAKILSRLNPKDVHNQFRFLGEFR